MKVTLKFDNKSISVNTEGGFELLVDDELLLAHEGDDAGYEKVEAQYATDKDLGCCGGCKCGSAYPKTSGASSLFVGETCLKDVVYLVKEVENSSFIAGIRWWSQEPVFGDNVLEVSLKDGRVMYYGDVPQVEVEAWMNFVDAGSSAGRFFNANIKNKFELLREDAGDE